jgi:HK97 family phage portal protein
MDEETIKAMKEDLPEAEKAARMRDDTALKAPNVSEIEKGLVLKNENSKNSIQPMHPLRLMTDITENCNWVDFAVSIIGAACASTNPTFRIESPNKKRKSQIEKITDMLNYPNLHQTAYDLFLYTYESLPLYGNAYWQVVYNRAGDIHSIYTLPPETMRVIPWLDQNNILHFAYYQESAAENRYFMENEIIHFKLPNERSFCYGKPEFYSQLVQIASAINAQKAVASWFEEGYVGGKIFKMEVDEDAAARNRTYLKDMFTKPENFGRALLLEGGIEMVDNGDKLKNFDFSTLANTDRDNILNSVGIPVSMAGVRSAAGNANAEVITAEERFFNRVVIDKYHKIVFNTLNNSLFRQILGMKDVTITPGILTKFSMSYEIATAEAASKYGSTVNELRNMLGMQPVPDEKAGNTWIAYTNNGLAPADKILGIDFNTGEKVESVFDTEFEAKKKEITGGSSGLGNAAKKKLEGN